MQVLQAAGPAEVPVLEAIAAGRVTWSSGLHLLDGERMRCRPIVPLILGGFARYELADAATFDHVAVLTAAGADALRVEWGLV